MTAKFRLFLTAIALLALTIAPSPTRAGQGDVPALMTQTGRLFDASEQPVTGDRAMAFTLYDVPSGGTARWTETHTVTFDDGYFVIQLGQTTSLPLMDGTPRYLGIRVADDPEMTPREELVSVPYALVAGDVIGDIHPDRVFIGNMLVIDAQGRWVGDPTGLVGPAGPAGAAGPMGNAGPAGIAGPAGVAGPVGPPGAVGPAGATGPAGLQGPVGNVGPMGPMGATGLMGIMGPLGPVGPAGAIGPVGPVGAAGTAGAIGPVGPAGASGAVGPTGAVGPAGPAGASGTAGAIGPVGPAGPTGAAGSIGPVGPAGAAGSIGPVGPAGAVGAVGPPGARGLTGATGPAGSVGPTGATGAMGPAGPVGATGQTGLTGATGAMGPAGTNGTNGTQGPMGPAGPSSVAQCPPNMARVDLGTSTLCVWAGGSADHDTAVEACFNLNFGTSRTKLCTVEQYRQAACFVGAVGQAPAVWHGTPFGGQSGMFAVSTGCSSRSVEARFANAQANVYCCVEWMNY